MSKKIETEGETTSFKTAAPATATAMAEKIDAYSTPAPKYDSALDYDTSDQQVEASDLLQPHWRLLQAMSGEVKRSEPEFIEGAREGQWYDTLRKELFDEIIVLLVDWRTAYLEWRVPRTSGGFMGDHGTAPEAAAILRRCHKDKETGMLLTGEGSEIVETAIRYCIVVGGKPAGEKEFTMELCRPAILSFYKTSQKAGKDWLTQADLLRKRDANGIERKVAKWASTFLLGSEPKRNEKGSWFIPTVERYIWREELPNADEVGETVIQHREMLKRQFSRLVMRSDDDRPTFAKALTHAG